MNRQEMLELCAERHKVNRLRIKAYCKCENLDGAEISRQHASTALSNARKEQLLVELVCELLKQCARTDVVLTERATEGFDKLVAPRERHYNYDGTRRY